MTIDTRDFETRLRADGFEVIRKSMGPATALPDHSHDFEVRAVVTDGEIEITCDGETRRYATGDVFTMAAGKTHSEQVGADGVSYVVGRKTV